MSFEYTIQYLPKGRRKAVSNDQCFATVLQPFTWKTRGGMSRIVAYSPQTRPYDAPESNRYFETPPRRKILISNEAVAITGMQLIKECLLRLHRLAELHGGIYPSQKFEVLAAGYTLWFTDEGIDRPIRVLFDGHFEYRLPPVSPVVEEWIRLSRRYKGEPGQARVLDIVKHCGGYYFVDDRLKELRNVEDVMDTIKFKTYGELMHFRMNECLPVT